MRQIIIILFSVFIALGEVPAQAQFSEPTISFDKLNHNFGNIKEEDGVVDYTFKFSNTGQQPLILNTVRPSCGCTVAEWSKEPIPPGGEGTVKVTFNPLRRPGAFRKSITVISNAKKKTTILYIVGLVAPKPKTISDEYRMEMGPIRLVSNQLAVMKVAKTQKKSATLNIINTSDHDVRITIPEAPVHWSFSVQPETLQPQQKGKIIGNFDATKVDDWGFISSRIALYFNGEKFNGNRLYASATVEEDFSQLSPEQKARGPRMVLSEDTYNFGSIKQGEIIEHDFKFKNEGKEVLIIRKIRTTCGCTASKPSSNEIAPGEEGTLHVTFNSRAKKGKQLQTITVITNDPNKPTHLLRLAGAVELVEK